MAPPTAPVVEPVAAPVAPPMPEPPQLPAAPQAPPMQPLPQFTPPQTPTVSSLQPQVPQPGFGAAVVNLPGNAQAANPADPFGAQPQAGGPQFANPADPFGAPMQGQPQMAQPDELLPIPPQGARDPERWIAAQQRRQRELDTRQRMVQNRAEQRGAARGQRLGIARATPPTITRPLAEAMVAQERGDAAPYQTEMLARLGQGPSTPEVQVARIAADAARYGVDANRAVNMDRNQVDRFGHEVQRDVGMGGIGVQRELGMEGHNVARFGIEQQARDGALGREMQQRQLEVDAWVAQQQQQTQRYLGGLGYQQGMAGIGADMYGHQMMGRGQDIGFQTEQMRDATNRLQIQSTAPTYAETVGALAPVVGLGAAGEIAQAGGTAAMAPLFPGAPIQVSATDRQLLRDATAEEAASFLRTKGADENTINAYLNQEHPRRWWQGAR